MHAALTFGCVVALTAWPAVRLLVCGLPHGWVVGGMQEEIGWAAVGRLCLQLGLFLSVIIGWVTLVVCAMTYWLSTVGRLLH